MSGAGTQADFSIGTRRLFGADFDLSCAGGYTPTPQEKAYVDRLRDLLGILSDVKAEADAVGPERARERDDCARELQELAEVFVKCPRGPCRDTLATAHLYESFRLEGRYRERILRIEAIPFVVTTVPPDAAALVTDVRIGVRDVRIPDDMKRFKVAIDQAKTVVKTTIVGEHPPRPLRFLGRATDFARAQHSTEAQKKLDEYLRSLAGIARVGLMNIDATQAAFAALALDGFKAEFVAREAGIVKNNYVLRLGLHALLALLVAVVVYAIASHMPGTSMFRLRNVFVLLAGAAVGTWLSFSIRRVELGFNDLANLENDRLNPGLRVLFVIALTAVVGLLLWTKAVTFGIGELQSNFQTSGTRAALIGALCGIAERAIATAVGRRAADFAAGVGGQTRSPA
ncbi:MAG TPA: hypothetical protein VMF12_18525 [Xanthobacteraceae bacterium]|nr:hypothetical protein [Xanthobacteraceae bacterium]